MTTIYSPNPLPSHIDWEEVGRTLGVTIEQGSPTSGPFRTSAPIGDFSYFSDLATQQRQRLRYLFGEIAHLLGGDLGEPLDLVRAEADIPRLLSECLRLLLKRGDLGVDFRLVPLLHENSSSSVVGAPEGTAQESACPGFCAVQHEHL